MNHRLRKFGLVLLAGAALAAAAACGGDDHAHASNSGDGPPGSIKVLLVNWAVQPAKTSAPAGSVTFHVVHDMGHTHTTNEGGNTHDLQVAKKGKDGSFEVVGQIQGLAMGDEKDLTLNLSPGDYELQCNVVEMIDGKPIAHYVKGMHTPFKVS